MWRIFFFGKVGTIACNRTPFYFVVLTEVGDVQEILYKRLTNLSPSTLYCLYERAFWFLHPDLTCGAETPICLTHSSLLFPSVFPSDAWGHCNCHPSIDSTLLSFYKFQDNNPIISISE